jgi:hypothetical protein
MKLDRKENLAVYAILSALGEFSHEQMKGEKTCLIGELMTLYGEHPSSAVHAASGWLLRKWGQREMIEKIDSKSVHNEPGREWFNIAISLEDESQRNPDSKSVSTNYTFVVFPPGEYMVGSPEYENFAHR